MEKRRTTSGVVTLSNVKAEEEKRVMKSGQQDSKFEKMTW